MDQVCFLLITYIQNMIESHTELNPSSGLDFWHDAMGFFFQLEGKPQYLLNLFILVEYLGANKTGQKAGWVQVTGAVSCPVSLQFKHVQTHYLPADFKFILCSFPEGTKPVLPNSQ